MDPEGVTWIGHMNDTRAAANEQRDRVHAAGRTRRIALVIWS